MRSLIITQARMASSRLPAKILLEVAGNPLINYHLARLERAGSPICVATSTSATDTILCEHLAKIGARYFRGSEEDVLSRFYECATEADAELIVRITADCPLIDGDMIRQAIGQYRTAADSDLYLSNTTIRTYPRGFDFEVFSYHMLARAHREATAPHDREHVTTYIRRNIGQQFKNADFLFSRDTSHLRLTVDEPADFALVKILISEYSCQDWPADKIIELLEKHPELAEINRAIEQKKVPGLNLKILSATSRPMVPENECNRSHHA